MKFNNIINITLISLAGSAVGYAAIVIIQTSLLMN